MFVKTVMNAIKTEKLVIFHTIFCMVIVSKDLDKLIRVLLLFTVLLFCYAGIVCHLCPYDDPQTLILQREKMRTRRILHDLKQPSALLLHAISEEPINAPLVSSLIRQITSRVHSINRSLDDVRTFTTMNLHSFIEEFASAYRPLFSARSMTFETFTDVPTDLCVLAPSDDISRCVETLISNAYKFTADVGKVSIVSSVILSEDSCLVKIEVHDTGKGIDDVEDSDLFWKDDFKAQMDSIGLGLGLPSVKTFSERESGSVWCRKNDSEVNGSIFGFSFKTNLTKDTTDGSEAGGSMRGNSNWTHVSNLRVLVVEDDGLQLKINVMKVKKRFSNFCHIKTAKDGMSGLKMLQESEFDICFSDMNLPVLDGAHMYRRAKSLGVLPKIFKLISAQTFDIGHFDEFGLDSKDIYDKTDLKRNPFNDAADEMYANQSQNENNETEIMFDADRITCLLKEVSKEEISTCLSEDISSLETSECQEEWRLSLHKLKGSCGLIGALSVVELCDSVIAQPTITKSMMYEIICKIKEVETKLLNFREAG